MKQGRYLILFEDQQKQLHWSTCEKLAEVDIFLASDAGVVDYKVYQEFNP